MKTTKRHRKPGPHVRSSYPIDFRPRHCSGTGCTHNHAGASTLLRDLGTWGAA